MMKAYPLYRNLLYKTAAKHLLKNMLIDPFFHRREYRLPPPSFVKKEFINKLLTGSVEFPIDRRLAKYGRIKKADLVIVGHLHEMSDGYIDGQRVIKVTTFRDEYG